MMRPCNRKGVRRRGSIVVLAAAILVVVIGFLAFSIDYGDIVVTQSELQNAADAGAMSGAKALAAGRGAASEAAKDWSAKNLVAGKAIVVTNEDVEIGRWHAESGSFTIVPEGSSTVANAVRVTCRLSAARGTQLNLFFAPLIGTQAAELSATAIAVRPVSRMGMRFLIDDEMIDTDVPAIQDLASALGCNVEDLLTAKGFNQGKLYGGNDWKWEDNFLDIPTGQALSLPTGQGVDYGNNDTGLFDTVHADFPFQDNASLLDFLTYSDSGNDQTKWGTDNSWVKGHLDPLSGVTPVTDGNGYQDFVDPEFVHVSPVTFSDVSTLNMAAGSPRVNAHGLRRGLLAFKIVAVGPDYDGAGSLLPELVIEIVDPTTIDPNSLLPAVAGSSSRRLTKLVQ